MNSTYFVIDGEVSVGITITELADGALQFDLQVLTELGTIGDLNALYLDIGDATLLDGLSVTSSTDVTGEKYQEDKVTKIDNFTNVNGEVVNEYGKFDLGIQFGTSGMAVDDIQSTTFVLSHATETLTIDDFLGQDTALRLTSVGTVDGDREDSLKLGGTLNPEEPEGPVHEALDDTMTVSSNETFNAPFPDLLSTGGQLGLISLLDNDTTDGADYTGDVLGVNGIALTDAFQFAGSNGGLLQMNADGSVDFSANSEFDDLGIGETSTTTFDYFIEGGATAVLTVTVFGADENTGGGGGVSEGGTSGPSIDDIDPDLLPQDDTFGF